MTEISRCLTSDDTRRPRRPLRVCHLAYPFYDTDNRVLRYATALAERGDEVDVVALRRPGQSRQAVSNGVHLFRIQERARDEKAALSYLLKIVWFLARSAGLVAFRHLRRPYDLVHVHNVPDFLVFAAIVPKLFGGRIILDIHDVLPELYAGKFGVESNSTVFKALVIAERLSCRFADHVLVANHIWHERLVARSVPVSRCTAFLNYPDLRIFKPRSHDSERDDKKFIILYPGSLNRYQGVDVAVRAFALALGALPNAEFHIYGEGPARPELNDLVQDLGLQDRVFLHDPLPIDQIARVMAGSHLAVEPKQAIGFSNEALSTKILEFMSCRVPVIASRTLVHAHYFDHTVVRFFTPGDHHDLASAMADVYARYPEHLARVTRAQEFASRYGWHRRVEDYYVLADSLAAPVGQRMPLSIRR
jgi:glycosyltransferase involved in cell wall biosynthesis